LPEQRSPSRRFLPPDPRTAEPWRLTPQLALRIGVLGMVVLAAFAVLLLRLWSLQILSGERYLNAAQDNQLRTVRLQAPRGPILDRNGRVLVGNTPGQAVLLRPADLPEEGRYQVLRRLSKVVDVPVPWMVRQIEKRKGDPLTPIVVKRGVHDDQVAYIEERRDQFQGVSVARSYLRSYPYRALGAHIFGHVGEITQEQLEARDGLAPGDEIGQGGIEAAYDDFLRGESGLTRLRVDSLGRPRGSFVPFETPRPGYALRVTIDVDLQRAAEQALRRGIELAQANDEWYADGGALVALDPRNGEILAMASNPTFKPSVFVGRTDPRKLAPLLDRQVAEAANVPALNRATLGTYAPGSTFKPVTALAAMAEHLVSPYSTLACTADYERDGHTFNNWDPYVNQAMTMPVALARSCDTYFYELGARFYDLGPDRGHPLQNWATRFGFGDVTGIDVGPEDPGLLPTPEWRRQTFKTEIDRLWKSGDSIQLAIGQKDMLVTPLQMARFYALIANGGRLVTPHLAVQAERSGQGVGGAGADVVQRFNPPAPQPSGVDPAALQVVQDGLLQATHFPFGTSAGIFDSFPVPIAGKTGTAEKWSSELGRYLDQSWWCGYGPADNPELVVCALIENGGHGGTAAAPAARMVFERYFGVEGGQITQVNSD
jgi:penicillin-binding protein 2